MPRALDQRYVPTDLRSQVLYFLWSIGFDKEGERDLMATIIMNALREQQARRTNGSSTN
ncbi:MAG: hypothetical protein K2X82_17900 [Gemmataceae bacterium]|nr:hypothetical protein [Gemmataceae bacterium]